MTTAKKAQANPAYFDQSDDDFDTEQAFYEYMQEEAEATLHLDMHHRTPARFDNDAWA
jgi:hypothetical protein